MHKVIRLSLLLMIGVFTSLSLAAQNELSREETKVWKDKAKEYRRNLPALKALVEEHGQYQDQVVTLQQQVGELQAQLAMKDRQISTFNDSQAELNQRVIAAETTARNAVNQPAPPPPPTTATGSSPSITGTIFRVQIGAFEKKRIDLDLATGNEMLLQETAGGIQKVAVGEFRTYGNAQRLRDKLREIGVDGAFVVAFQDGQSIDVTTAIQYTGETIDE